MQMCLSSLISTVSEEDGSFLWQRRKILNRGVQEIYNWHVTSYVVKHFFLSKAIPGYIFLGTSEPPLLGQYLLWCMEGIRAQKRRNLPYLPWDRKSGKLLEGDCGNFYFWMDCLKFVSCGLSKLSSVLSVVVILSEDTERQYSSLNPPSLAPLSDGCGWFFSGRK